jgi:hypothetical protein
MEGQETEQGAVNETDLRDWGRLQAEGAAFDKKHGLSVGDEVNDDDSEAAADDLEIGALMATVIQTTADIFAPNWEIQSEESEQLGVVYGALLDKYMPDNGLGKYSVELSALVVTAAVIKSRQGVPMRLPEKTEKKNAADVIESQQAPQKVINESSSGVLMPKAVKHG